MPGVRATSEGRRSRVLKGAPAQLAVQRILEAEGYLVHNVFPVKVKRGGLWLTLQGDIWGAVDLVGVHQQRGFVFAQVTTSSGVYKRRRKLEAIPWPQGEGYEVTVWESRSRRVAGDPRRREDVFKVHVYRLRARAWESGVRWARAL